MSDAASAKPPPLDFTPLIPKPGSALSRGPFRCLGDGTILDAQERVFCVLGDPNSPLEEQDITNGAAILALPELIQAATDLACKAAGVIVYVPAGEPHRTELLDLVERAVSLVRSTRGALR